MTAIGSRPAQKQCCLTPPEFPREDVRVDTFKVGDRVEYIGPAERDRDAAQPGEIGTIMIDEDPGFWVVSWDRVGAEVCPEDLLRKIN
jgi:hypothetical protein